MKKIIFLSIICIISLIINKHAIAENKNLKKVILLVDAFGVWRSHLIKLMELLIQYLDIQVENLKNPTYQRCNL